MIINPTIREWMNDVRAKHFVHLNPVGACVYLVYRGWTVSLASDGADLNCWSHDDRNSFYLSGGTGGENIKKAFTIIDAKIAMMEEDYDEA